MVEFNHSLFFCGRGPRRFRRIEDDHLYRPSLQSRLSNCLSLSPDLVLISTNMLNAVQELQHGIANVSRHYTPWGAISCA